MVPFLEENKDFILKLKIQTADDQTQIRRVSLSRIADANGNISYEELVDLVLVFSLPEEDDIKASARTYTVSLTYYDDEKDLITLSSTEELMDAIELFAGKRFVRITTSVKPKISYSAPPTSARTCAQDTTTSSSNNRGTSTKGEKYSVSLPIQVVLESFAGILSTAVDSLQEGLANQSPTSPTESDLQLEASEASPSNKPNKISSNAKDVARNKKGQQVKAVNGDKVDKISNNLASRKNNMSCANSASNNNVLEASNTKKSPPNNKEKIPSGSQDKTKVSEESFAVEPFIHGRHTCDSCLRTPIIGKRYHSTNLPDYDVCQNCFDNYKGNVIKYESVELRRDVAFQNRWRRRRQMTTKLMAGRYQSGRGNCGPRVPHYREQNHQNCNSYRVATSSQDGPGFVVGGNGRTPSQADRNKSSYTHTVDQNEADTNLTARDNDSSSNEFDNLLKEAIRRSLDDVVPKEDSTTKTNEAEKMTKNHLYEALILSKEKPPVEDKVSENNVREVKNDIPRSVDIVEHKTAEVERLSNSGATSENASISFEFKDVETMQEVVDTMRKTMDTDSVDSEKLLSESSEPEALPTNTDNFSKSPLKEKGLDTSKNDSFASDAVGNGDIAEVMGKTLDMVAGVITEMLSESEEVQNPNMNGKVLESESKEGELIVNPNDDVPKVDEGEDDADWSVVKSIGSSGTTESEQIGKAAEMLGSALFNSDMKNSTEDKGSSLIGSDSSFSIPSSVPTDLGTVQSRVAGPSQVSQWATELKILQELGFDNEASCIEVLERIGSDSNTIETDMDRVVDELLFLNA